MLYLAAPYSHPDPEVTAARMLEVNYVFAQLVSRGELVFSVLSMTHVAALDHGLPGDHNFWSHYNFSFLKNCNALYVLCLPGWGRSLGVRQEIKWARQLHLPVIYIDTMCNVLQESELPA